MTKTILSPAQHAIWTLEYQEGCAAQAICNLHLGIHIGVEMLQGTGHYATAQAQVNHKLFQQCSTLAIASQSYVPDTKVKTGSFVII